MCQRPGIARLALQSERLFLGAFVEGMAFIARWLRPRLQTANVLDGTIGLTNLIFRILLARRRISHCRDRWSGLNPANTRLRIRCPIRGVTSPTPIEQHDQAHRDEKHDEDWRRADHKTSRFISRPRLRTRMSWP